jgi:putrescine aminotransferase
VQGAGGLVIPPETYWPEIQRIVDKYGILFASDEVICGFGRTGQWFGCEHYGTRPDFMTMAKALSSGYLPIGGLMAGDRVADVLIDKGGEFFHGFTYSGHPAALCCGHRQPRGIPAGCVVERVREEAVPYLASRWRELRLILWSEKRAAWACWRPSNWFHRRVRGVFSSRAAKWACACAKTALATAS